MFKFYITLFLFLVGCDNSDSYSKYKPAEKGTYKLEECISVVKLNWGGIDNDFQKKSKVISASHNIYKKYAMYYYFSSYTIQNNNREMLFTFYNYCEKKDIMLKEYIEKHLSHINEFPKYEIIKSRQTLGSGEL